MPAPPLPVARPAGVTPLEAEAPRDSDPKSESRIVGWWRDWLRRLNGEEGASYLLSLVVHVLLLCVCMLFPAFRHAVMTTSISTILGGGDSGAGDLGPAVNTELAMPQAAAPNALDANWAPELGAGFSAPEIHPAALGMINGQGDGGGGGEGEGVSGIRIPNPNNSVRMGSFTVWTWPIAGKDLKGTILHDTPGGAPRAYQDYHVVIRMRVPGNVRAVKASDFSGSIVGTDGYRQKIPDAAFFYNAKGELLSARGGRNVPVVDGTVELLIEVPGAKSALIEDTIKVVSEILNEEQEIKLVFQAR